MEVLSDQPSVFSQTLCRLYCRLITFLDRTLASVLQTNIDPHPSGKACRKTEHASAKCEKGPRTERHCPWLPLERDNWTVWACYGPD
jgi:hypothetical protein